MLLEQHIPSQRMTFSFQTCVTITSASVFRGRGMHGGRGHAWQGGACVAGGMYGRGVCMAGGHAWQGAYMAGDMHGRGQAWHAHPPPPRQQILRDSVNERVVRILLECILVSDLLIFLGMLIPINKLWVG